LSQNHQLASFDTFRYSKVMPAKIVVCLLLFTAAFALAKPVLAAENPLAVPNNKIGIHILDVSELPAAAKLVNSNGGDWGYVTIPIQAGDYNYAKWQGFMNNCIKYHVIPIIRLATDDDSANPQDWRKPDLYDVINFANFLNSLTWPTKNRYVIVFNEVNRADEWGGSVDPTGYAQLLSFADTIFKSENPDFFIISAGMDNAAPDEGTTYMDEYTYFKDMNQAVPGIFNQIDGISSHSYPNPGFAQAPDATSPTGVGSFIQERSLIESMSSKQLPVFITETGWSASSVNQDQQVQYYDEAMKNVWNDPDIVAITPFLLQAGAGPFEQFSFLTGTGSATEQYQYIYGMQKVKGVPSFPTHVLAATTKDITEDNMMSKSINGVRKHLQSQSNSMINTMANFFAYFLHR
jgi:hypothetical protein